MWVQGADVGGEGGFVFFEFAEVAIGLDAEPEAWGLSEVFAEADGHFGGDGAAAEDDLVDGPWGYAEGAAEGVL